MYSKCFECIGIFLIPLYRYRNQVTEMCYFPKFTPLASDKDRISTLVVSRRGQDDRVGRPSPTAHQNYTICRATIYKRDQKTSRKDLSTTKDIKEKPQWDRGVVQSRPTPREVTHKQEDSHNCRGSFQGGRGLGLTSGSSTQGSCIGNMSSQDVCLWRSVGFAYRRTGGVWDLLLKGVAKSHILWVPEQRQQFERRLIRLFCWCWGAPQERREVTETPLGTQTLAKPYWGAHFATRTLCLLSAILESSF